MKTNITIEELQDSINERLKKYEGSKYTGKEAATPVYHKWYMNEIESELSDRGIDIFHAATWKIVAEIDGPGEVRVSFEEVATVTASLEQDRRYKYGGPGKIKSILVQFREDLQSMTIEEARVYLLKSDLKNRLAYYRKERERLAAELEAVAAKIADLTTITIEEAAK